MTLHQHWVLATRAGAPAKCRVMLFHGAPVTHGITHRLEYRLSAGVIVMKAVKLTDSSESTVLPAGLAAAVASMGLDTIENFTHA